MKTFKLIKSIILILLISIAGCSDEIISPVTQGSGMQENQNKTMKEIEERMHTKMSLKPKQVHTFNFANTGFYTFHSISILGCGKTKYSVDISGQYKDEQVQLGCNSGPFKMTSITVMNVSNNSVVDLDIYLTGSKSKEINPWPSPAEY